MRNNIEDVLAENILHVKKFRMAAAIELLAGAKTLSVEEAPIQILDPGGSARTVTLPAENISDGLMFMIKNAADAAEVITVENDAAATVATLAQNESAWMFCDGISWHGSVGSNT